MSSNSTSARMQAELTPDGGRFWLLAIIFILCAINYANTRWSKFPLPVIERTWRQMLQYSSPAVELVERGYSTIIKQLGRPFRLWYWGQEYIILPLEYLIDVKRADKEHLSFLKSISDIFFLKYWISDLFETERMVYTVKKGLNPRLNETTQICIDEAADAFLQEFGQCDDFTSAGAVEAFCGIAHRIASVILISKKVSEDPAFKKASYSYFQGHAITGGLLLFLPLGPLRHYLAGPISYFQRVRQRRVLSIVAAEFQERLNGAGSGKTHIDGIEWTIKMLKEFPGKPGEPLPLFQMSHELVHILGAAHTPVGMTLTQMVWQMLVQPEYLHTLRKEAEEAVAKVGFTDRIVEYLPLQDSYIREANRLYPSNIVGTQRIVCGAPFVFSDGFTLPVGSRIAFPVGPYLRDPDVYSRPDEFDGERFVKLGNADARTEDGVNRWAASHAHKHNLAFGYGNHVCPGRFFAVRLIKVIFTKLILEYDIRSEWKGDGVPPSWNLEGSIISHTSARISLKKRESD